MKWTLPRSVRPNRRNAACALLITVAGSGLVAKGWQEPAESEPGNTASGFAAVSQQYSNVALTPQQATQARASGRSGGFNQAQSSVVPLSATAGRFPSSGQFAVAQVAGGQSRSQIVQGLATTPRDSQNPRIGYYYSSQLPSQPEDAEIRKLVKKLKDAGDDGDPETQEQLRYLVQEQFNRRQSTHIKQVQRLAAQLEKAKEALDAREKNRDDIVARRVKSLLGQTDRLDWGYTPQITGSQERSPNASTFPRAMYGVALPGQSPTAVGIPVPPQAAKLNLPGLRSSTNGLSARINSTQNQLNVASRAAKAGLVSAGELDKLRAELETMRDELKDQERSLRTQVEHGKIDVEVAKRDVVSLHDELASMTRESKERFDVNRQLAHAEAALRKAELSLEVAVQSYEEVKKAKEKIEKAELEKQAQAERNAAEEKAAIAEESSGPETTSAGR